MLTLDFDDSETLAPTTTPSWPRTGSSTRSCSGSRTRRWPSGAGRARGGTGRSTTCTRDAGFTSSARTGMCGRLSRTRMLRGDGGIGGVGGILGLLGGWRITVSHLASVVNIGICNGDNLPKKAGGSGDQLTRGTALDSFNLVTQSLGVHIRDRQHWRSFCF